MKRKKKFTLEYAVGCTTGLLFSKLSTDTGLGSWFADRVERENNRFTFFWQQTPQAANLIGQRENRFVRFRWDEEEDPEAYFELAINPYEFTGDLALSITDFSDHDEYEDAVRIWENNIRALKRALGCR
jgi:hypothetical protein